MADIDAIQEIQENIRQARRVLVIWYRKKKEKELTLFETSKVVNQLMELDLCNELFKRDSNGGFTILETSIENLLIQVLRNDIDKHKNKSID